MEKVKRVEIKWRHRESSQRIAWPLTVTNGVPVLAQPCAICLTLATY